jgi:hypothetical protein
VWSRNGKRPRLLKGRAGILAEADESHRVMIFVSKMLVLFQRPIGNL